METRVRKKDVEIFFYYLHDYFYAPFFPFGFERSCILLITRMKILFHFEGRALKGHTPILK